ncbi:MAG: ABC transporter permease, partial [Myxococcota bacterium]
MLLYALKRLLLIPPTLFLISLVIFVVLNMAPGRPGAGGGSGSESSSDAAQAESYRYFQEQFGLDKPTLLNTRPWLSVHDARAVLDAAENGTPRERVRARETIEDVGLAFVRHYVALLDDTTHARQALKRLPAAARLPVRARATPQSNRMAMELNQKLASLKTAEDWRGFFAEHRSHYEWTTREAIGDLFFDTRFAHYWGNLLRLDFGNSLIDRRPVMDTLAGKLRYSLSLTLLSIVLAYLIAVPLGIFSAARQGTMSDGVLTLVLFALYSLPTFFSGTVLLRLLSEGDPVAWFPTGGFESMEAGPMTTAQRLADIVWHLMLPVATYTAVTLAALSRYARAGVIDVIRSDYVRTARAKGLPEIVVVVKHAARNGMIPILTLLGSLLPLLVSGSVVIE